MIRWTAMTVLAASGFVATPSLAQQQDQDRDEDRTIIVEGERQERERPSDTDRTVPKRIRHDQRIASSGAMGATGVEGGHGADGSVGSMKDAYEFGSVKVDWARAKAGRELDTKSPVVRYGDAGRMAYCSLLSVGDGASAYVDTSPDPDYDALTHAYRYKHIQCADAAERSSPAEMVNAALAEMLVMKNVEQPPLRAEAVDAGAAQQFMASGKSSNGLDAIGRCAAVFSPGYAFDVLYTTPGSPEEREMFDLLYANTPECGLRERPAKVNTVYQRMAVAMGLYRWYGLSGEEWSDAP